MPVSLFTCVLWILKSYNCVVLYAKNCVILYAGLLLTLRLFFSLKIDFNLHTRWPEYSYLYLYELFCKASVLKNDHNFFRPVSQLKTSVIVWYLLSSEAPCSSVFQLTASQAKSIWNLTDDDLDKVNDDVEGKKMFKEQ